jgi:ion channel-forming bestrophin family protein
VVEDDTRVRRADEAFWTEIFALKGSVTPYVFRRVLIFALIALVIYVANELFHGNFHSDLGPYEVAGAVIGLLLVFRTNAGYDRWYEGRKLLGGIVNDSRNLAITVLAHGPNDRAWRESVVRWIAAYGHTVRAALRNEGVPREVRSLLGNQWAAEISQAECMPTFVALRIGEFLRQACEQMGMDRFAFMQADLERARLIDCFGACERITKTPIPWAYSVNIRRIIFLYMIAVPFALLERAGTLTPLVTMLVAYPILSLDQIGVELQKPFSPKSLNHLPLDEITARIETDLLALLAQNHHLPAAAPSRTGNE